MSERILPERFTDEIRRLRKDVDALMFGSSPLRSASVSEGGMRLRNGGSLRVEGGDIIIEDADGNETFRASTDGLDLLGLLSVTGDIDITDGGTLTVDGGDIVIKDDEGVEAMRLASDGLSLQGVLEVDGRFDFRDDNDDVRVSIRGVAQQEQANIAYRSGPNAQEGGEVLAGAIFWIATNDLAGHGILVQMEDGTDLLQCWSLENDEARFRVAHDNGNRAIWVGDGFTELYNVNGDTVFLATQNQTQVRDADGQVRLLTTDQSTSVRNPNGETAFRALDTQTLVRKPDGSGSGVTVENDQVSLHEDTVVFADFDVTGSKNAAIEAPDGNTYRFGADESPHAGRLVYDFEVEVINGTAEVALPDSLGMVASDAWVRGPWPQGHPGGDHYAELDGETLRVHGAAGRYMVEVVAYRADDGVSRWEHVARTSGRRGRPSPRSREDPEPGPGRTATGPNR